MRVGGGRDRASGPHLPLGVAGPGSDGRLGRVPPTVLILSGGISVQIGAGTAAFSGLALLSQSLSAHEWVAIVFVTVASAGAARATPRAVPPPQA